MTIPELAEDDEKEIRSIEDEDVARILNAGCTTSYTDAPNSREALKNDY